MGNLKDKLAGKFIVIDGPDGAGKSTQLKLLAEWLRGQGLDVEVFIDPGTTKIGQKIRQLLLDRENGEIGGMCETLLFMASRAQLTFERIRPALGSGKVVVCDRFVSSTLAYQGASGVDPHKILTLAEIAIEGLWPDLTLILDVTTEEGTKRIGVDRSRLKKPAEEEMQKLGAAPQRARKAPDSQMFLFGDRMEARSSSYHERVRDTFRRLSDVYPRKVRNVDAMGPPDDVFAEVVRAIREEFPG
jgi:dTMP kinase